MPLLITPPAPLRTTSLLEISSVYVIIDFVAFHRKLRRAEFRLGYYAYEQASLPNAAAQVEVNLPLAFSLTMTPAEAALVGDPEQVLEAYAEHELQQLLPGATIERVL